MKKSLFLFLMLLVFQANAQTNPITAINISLPPNPDANTANWGLLTINANSGAVNGRVNGFVVESKILLLIKKNGSKICGAYTSSTAPSANFNTLTKVWSGRTAVALFGQDCKLPAGDYELSVQFFGYSNGKINALSEEKTKAFTIKGNEQPSYQGPQAIAPINATTIKERDALKPITFRWTPIVPRPQEPTTYRLRVWQLMQGQNGTQARLVNQPIFTKDVDNLTQTILSNLYTGPCKPPYLCEYVWNVQALNRDGKPIGGNNGTSETFNFSVASTDKKPPMIKLISPANGSVLAANERPNFTYTITVSPVNDALTKIKVVVINGDQSPEVAFRTNKPIFEKDSTLELKSYPNADGNLKVVTLKYPPNAPKLEVGKKYVWGVSIFDRWGNLSTFSVANCDVNLALKLRSIECLPDVGRNKMYRINFSSTYTSGTYNLTYTQTGSGLSAYHPSYSPNYTITNFSPALMLQNSGASTSVNYSFEVSVPIGQTAIKIGLQGDDKDSGPITCKPGAELDINLPVCINPTCDCGKWGSLNVKTATAAGFLNRTYNFGSGLVWKCNQPFSFTSSYLCGQTDGVKCQAKTSWEIKKDGVVIKTGTGINSIADTFTPTSNGTYIITLDAVCGDQKCTPCTYILKVEDCKPPSCDCGTWGLLKIKSSPTDPKGMIPPALSYQCGSKVNWTCNKALNFSNTFQCKSNVADCKTQTSWEIKKDGVIIKSGNGLNNTADTFKPTENGTYTLTLFASCGGKDCPPCTYDFIVKDCKPMVSCLTPPYGMVAWWTFDEKSGQPFADRAGVDNAGTGMNNPLSLPAKVAGGLKFNGTTNFVDVADHAELNFGTGDFSFDAWIQTSDATGLKDLVDKRTTKGYLFYLIDGKLGFLIRNESTTNYNSSLFVADGKWHHIAITVERKNKKGILFYVDGVATQYGDPTLQPGNIDNTSLLRIGKDLYSSSYNFKGILDEIELFNRVVSKAEIVAIYQADYAGKCKTGSQVCDCGKWGSFKVQNAAGFINHECGTKKAIIWNCNKPLDFSSTYQCNLDNKSCAATTRWTVSKEGKVLRQGIGTNTLNGSFTPTSNGIYTITLDAFCGNKECPSCSYRVVVEDCRPPAEPCKLLCNTGFEEFVNITGTNDVVKTNEANIPCWKTTASDHKIEIWRSGYGSVPAASGKYFAEVNANEQSTLYQTFVATTPMSITISFAHRGRYTGNDTLQVILVAPSGSTTILGTYAANNTGWIVNTIVPYNILSTALGTYTLQFKSISSNNGKGPLNGGNFLDEVNITCGAVSEVACNCNEKPWEAAQKLAYNNGSKNVEQEITCLGNVARKIKIGSTMNYNVQAYPCNVPNCKVNYSWSVINRANGTVISNGTTTSLQIALAAPGLPGDYQFIIMPVCGTTRCKPCGFYFTTAR